MVSRKVAETQRKAAKSADSVSSFLAFSFSFSYATLRETLFPFLPNRHHRRLIELRRSPVRQNMNYPVDAAVTKHRGQHPDAVAVGSRQLMLRKRLRLGAHHHRPHFRCELYYPFYTASKVFLRRQRLPARFRQMLVPNAVVFQQLPQHRPIKLRPPRPRYASHVTEKLDLVLTKQLKKIIERVTAVADCVNDHPLKLNT